MSDSPLTHIEAYRSGLPPHLGRHFPVYHHVSTPRTREIRRTVDGSKIGRFLWKDPRSGRASERFSSEILIFLLDER